VLYKDIFEAVSIEYLGEEYARIEELKKYLKPVYLGVEPSVLG